jgi:hypothetical protein
VCVCVCVCVCGVSLCVCVCVQHITEHLVLVSSSNGVREWGIALFIRSKELRRSRDGVVITAHAAISAEILCRSAGAGNVILIEHVDLSQFRV